MKTNCFALITLLAILGWNPSPSQAQVAIAGFAFDGTAGSLNSTINPDDATVSTFGNGGNTTDAAYGFATRFGVNYAYWVPQGPLDASPGNPGGTGDGVHTAADNLAGGEFMTFTITADPGFTLNLFDIDYRAARNGGGGAINRLNLYVSVDGGAFGLVGTTLTLGDTSSPGVTTRDLSGATFQGIESAQFAFVFFNGNNQRGYLDDIVLTGTVIPEPSTYALLLGGLGALHFLRRRRNS